MNRLAGETSPYLLQHAGNPVDWYPWGEEAFARARREDKPVLLSIGYSACHWCHVMAHESFEDAAIAALMNAHFVNIKVDREERPDVDQIYQAAHAMLARRSGGWPLTMFLTPDQQPFFGGTYFPKSSRYGLPGFGELLTRVAAAYREQRRDIVDESANISAALARTNPQPEEVAESTYAHAPRAAMEALERMFDREHGGFGAAPKFPHVPELDFCLRRHAAGDEPMPLEMVGTTLARMAAGGIHDHLGGGFCRYSTDARWEIPHFEKMLYDNAALLAIYADAWRTTRDPRFERAARGIVEWLVRDMAGPDGGFCSSLDADSEGEEGRFYVWDRDEVRALLAPQEFAVAAAYWGLDGPPNFERKAWHLVVRASPEAIARARDLPMESVEALIESARAKLFARRTTRIPPSRDDKILASWNALAIGALARASRAFGQRDWLETAQAAADFAHRVFRADGRLVATYKDGRAHLDAYLDHHAFMLLALEELVQGEFRPEDLAWATEIAERLLDGFEDREHGGFFFTAHDHEPLIHRPKPGYDNATPSGNGIAARALATLGHWLGEPRYIDAAARAVRAFGAELARVPSGYASLLVALDDVVAPPTSVVLRGDAATCAAWHAALERAYRPKVQVVDLSRATPLPAALDKAPPGAGASAYVCRGTECLAPIQNLEDAVRAIDGASPAAATAPAFPVPLPRASTDTEPQR